MSVGKFLEKLIDVLEHYLSRQNVLLHKINDNQNLMLGKIERIQNTMATNFDAILDEAQKQGAQLDKVLAEVQAGDASGVTPEQLDQLKSVLDANQTKIQSIDDLHPDTPAPEQPPTQTTA